MHWSHQHILANLPRKIKHTLKYKKNKGNKITGKRVAQKNSISRQSEEPDKSNFNASKQLTLEPARNWGATNPPDSQNFPDTSDPSITQLFPSVHGGGLVPGHPRITKPAEG